MEQRWVMKDGLSLEVMHLRRKAMREYQRAGLHHTEFYREKGIVEWSVYKWTMPRARGYETCERWDRQTRRMWKDLVAQWKITKKVKRRSRRERMVREEAMVRRESEKTRPGLMLCAPLGLKGPGGKVQSTSVQWYDLQADMFRRDNIPGGSGQWDHCWRCTKEAGQVPWPVLRMMAWALSTATRRTTDVRGQW